MRIRMRQYTQAVLVLFVIASTSLIFQNCGGYQPADLSEHSSMMLEPLCTGASCQSTPEAILLSIGNAEPERLIPSDLAFDVGGYCDPAGYPQHRIYFQITGPTPTQIQAIDNGCDELGRFRIRVALPSNYNHSATHVLMVALRGVDAGGQEVDNPLGLNKRQLNIVTNMPQ
ncbi:MAG: hypothetical protein NDI61_07735 [Bdellovibrionaceae bacterium]|nr:hypothetical protein [Pseudobdellovibrionaceae bacterium]